MALTAATKTDLYRFFAIAFNAAPGVTYMNQLAEAANVMTVEQIVEVFTAKPEFLASYPIFFTNSQFANANSHHLNFPSFCDYIRTRWQHSIVYINNNRRHL